MSTIISSNPTHLADLNPAFTVEAEYGATTVKGTKATLAHHGANSHNPSPCNWAEALPAFEEGDVIGISHVDLDTVGGVMRVQGHSLMSDADCTAFWQLAEFVDVRGPHRLAEAGASELDLERLHAYWAFSQEARVFAPRDGSTLDVSEQVSQHITAIEEILDGNNIFLDKGEEFKAAGEALNEASLSSIEETGGYVIAVRSAEAFTNHLYNVGKANVCDAVLAYNEKFKSITLSFSDAQGDACAIMQEAFGPLAGGHKGIAGSPRGEELTFDDIQRVIEAMR